MTGTPLKCGNLVSTGFELWSFTGGGTDGHMIGDRDGGDITVYLLANGPYHRVRAARLRDFLSAHGATYFVES